MDFYDLMDCCAERAKVIEIEGNRLYWNGVKLCYAAHTLLEPLIGDCYISYSHRHQRDLILCAGTAWMGTNNGALPAPDIVIGSVVGSNGLLPDDGCMEHLIALIQAREDDGLKTKVRVA